MMEKLFNLMTSKQRDEQLYIMKKEHENFLWNQLRNYNSIGEIGFLYPIKDLTIIKEE